MKLFRRADLEALLLPPSPPCVSIYMPTVRHYPDTAQNLIRYKNLLKRATERLAAEDGDTRPLLERLEELANPAHALWKSPRAGLGVLASGAGLAVHLLPIAVEELVVVGASFHLKPMLKLLVANRRFLVLALSQHEAKAYEGTSYALSPVAIHGMPARVEDVIHPEQEPFRSQQTLRAGGAPGSGPMAVPDGHGSATDQRKEDAGRFFRHVDDALCAALHDEPLPVVLAGATPFLPIFREHSKYPHLVPEVVEGNFEHATLEDLHARAAPVAARHLDGWAADVLGEYDKGVSRGQGTTDLAAIGRAAVEGRISRLLLADGERIPGRFDRDTAEVVVEKGSDADGTEDVLDDLAEEVLRRRGDVLMLDRARMPGKAPVAAVMRW